MPGSPTGQETRTDSRVRVCGFALAGYIGCAALFLWPLVQRIGTHLYSHDQFAWPGMGGDEFPFLWMYWWMQKALAEGHSILHCDWIFPPAGANVTLRSFPFLPILATYPIGRTLGPVVGNNIMVMLMLAGGAMAFFVFCYRGLRLSAAASFCAGLLFGFAPYFVWKAGGQYNLIGAYAWAPALAIVFLAYMNNTFTLRYSILLAVFFWMTFWTSFIETFMLCIVLAVSVLVWEIMYWTRGDFSVARRSVFFAPVLLGLVSLVILRHMPDGHDMTVPIEAGISFKDLIPSAKLSFFSHIGFPNRTEAVIPHSLGWLFLLGLFLMIRRRTPFVVTLLMTAGILLAVVIDLFGIPSTMVRSLPLGGGFRYMQRFLPFLLFFMAIPAAYGLDYLIHHWRGRVRGLSIKAAALAGLALFALMEYYPYTMKLSPVRSVPLNHAVYDALDRDTFLFVLPGPRYYPAYDSYQVTLNMPAVYMMPWDHMSVIKAEQRARQFPAVYGTPKVYFADPYIPDTNAPDFFDELRALGVRYVLIPSEADPAPFEGRGRVLAHTERERLIDLGE